MVIVLGLVVAGCAQAPRSGRSFHDSGQKDQIPLIKLSPRSLGKVLVEQQRLTLIDPAGQAKSLDAMLEVDSQNVRLAFVQMGQVLARLEWNGESLTTDQEPWWPNEVSPQRILSDLQFARWPLAEVQAALPPAWSMDQVGGIRHLRHGDEDMVLFKALANGRTEIDYVQSGWALMIQSHNAATYPASEGSR